MNQLESPLLSIRNLYAGYDQEYILQNVNLDVYDGDFIGLIGPNGGGKSTLLKVILGLLPPKSGQVTILGMDVLRGRRHIGYIPQFVETDRDFPVSAWDTVKMGLLGGWRPFHRTTAGENQTIESALKQVEMFDLRNKAMGELSGGQRQRIFIARALVFNPRILLLDEPTASVDPNVTSGIYELLRELNQRVSILLVSHDMMAISSYTKTIACLNRRLIYHNEQKLTQEMLDAVYGCPVDLITHGLPHRVFAAHEEHKHG